MLEADLPAINLAILHQERSLCVSVTDSRSVGRVATIDMNRTVLDDLNQDAVQLRRTLLASMARPLSSSEVQDRLRELGRRLFQNLFPDTVRTFLVRCATRDLILQLSETLLPIPWEAAFDGTQFLGEKFRICRQIVTDEDVVPTRRAPRRQGLLRVLLVGSGESLSGPEARYATLLQRLQGFDGVAASAVEVGTLDREQMLGSIGESDVVHYRGPVAGCTASDGNVIWWPGAEPMLLQAIAALHDPPRLLISENVVDGSSGLLAPNGDLSLVKAACRSGLDLLACDGAPECSASAEFISDLYSQLAEGATVAEALRQARIEATRRGGAHATAVLSATLYGDPAVTLQTKRRSREDDSLRQVTIMSFDLVDSTRLLGSLGAEAYSEVLAAYHHRCTEIVGGFGGRPNDPQGNDGFMCYFGFPTAREDSAVHSLRAGLAIIDAVSELGLMVRAGVVTGRVVVKEGQPFGPAIHLAARLQSIAQPATLIVSDSTRQIVKGRFEFERIEHVPPLKGFDDPGPLYRLRGETRPGTRDLADAAPRLTPFTGRGRELQMLEEHWMVASAGAVRLVRVSGDAGIGKSRLVREFRRSLQSRAHRAFECRCAPEDATSALYPFIDLIRRLLRIQPDDAVDDKLDKIERMLHSEIDVDGAPALLAALLSISQSRYPRLEHSGDRQRQLTLEVLTALVKRQTRKAPTCLIVEDINWIDPSSTEFLDRLTFEARASPLLVLVTQRSETDQNWNPATKVHKIELKALPPEQARAMVLGACGDSNLPREVVRLLAERTDGVPLFIEESTRMLVELGASAVASDAATPLDFEVPATLQDLLMARLDRLGPDRLIAQVGGTIGREFSVSLLQAVLDHPGSPLKATDIVGGLTTLIQSGLLIERDEPPNTRVFFKHALVRDAAYRSLLERDRKRLHRVIAIVLGEQFAQLVETQPELLAHHYTQAELHADAVVYWERAARHAASRSAQHEAISHLTHGLAILDRLPPGAERDRIELRLQLLLASRFIATEGYGADRVERVYARALELCHLIGDQSALMKVQLGLEGYHFMRGNFAQALAFAKEAAAMAARSADVLHGVQSAWAIASILFHQGEMPAAVRQIDACLGEYDKLQHRPGAVQDPGVICLCYSAWGMWELGYPDQALQRALQVVDLAEGLGHNFSLGEAYGFRSTVHYFRRENEQALAWAQRAIEICDDGGFVVWLAHAKLMHGRLIVAHDDAAGVDEMREGYEMWTGTGAVVTRAFYLALRAEGLGLIGRPEEGVTLLEQALQIVRRCGERYYEAEIRRLYGELTLQAASLQGKDRNHEAETWFLGALERAHAQQLRSLALRSALSLARLWQSEGRSADAVRILVPALDWFTEGFDTNDLADARCMLVALNNAAALG